MSRTSLLDLPGAQLAWHSFGLRTCRLGSALRSCRMPRCALLAAIRQLQAREQNQRWPRSCRPYANALHPFCYAAHLQLRLKGVDDRHQVTVRRPAAGQHGCRQVPRRRRRQRAFCNSAGGSAPLSVQLRQERRQAAPAPADLPPLAHPAELADLAWSSHADAGAVARYWGIMQVQHAFNAAAAATWLCDSRRI